MKVRKPTELRRLLLGQQIRLVLDAEQAPPTTYRIVQILVPSSPQVVFSIDHPTDKEAGPNRLYKMPEVPPGAQITFNLQPQQKLYAAALSGKATPSLVIEYREEDD